MSAKYIIILTEISSHAVRILSSRATILSYFVHTSQKRPKMKDALRKLPVCVLEELQVLEDHHDLVPIGRKYSSPTSLA